MTDQLVIVETGEPRIVFAGEQGPPGPPGATTPPQIGEVRYFTQAPGAGWLLCDGAAHLRTEYPQYEALRPAPAWAFSILTPEEIGTVYNTDFIGYAFYTGQSLLYVTNNLVFRSVDDGLTWSKFAGPPVSWSPSIFRLPSGRIVVTNSFADYSNADKAYFSDDDGLTWTASTSTIETTRCTGAVVAGKLVLFFKGTNRAAISADGNTWTTLTVSVTRDYEFLAASDPAAYPRYFYGWTTGRHQLTEFYFNAAFTSFGVTGEGSQYLSKASTYVPSRTVSGLPALGVNDSLAFVDGGHDILLSGNSFHIPTGVLPAGASGGLSGRTNHGLFVTDCAVYGRFTKFMWSYDSGATWEHMIAPSVISGFANDSSFTMFQDGAIENLSAYQGGNSWMTQCYMLSETAWYGYFRVSHDTAKFNAPGLESVGAGAPYVYAGT